MANFNSAYDLTMKAEGGYSNNPADTGGETFKGVSRKNNPGWSGWAIIDAIKATNPPSLNAALNQNNDLLQKIMTFYQVNYWDVNHTSDINDQQMANQVFDTAVNCGTGTAAKFLQEAAGVTVDRMIGSLTLAAVNAADPKTLYNQFIGFRKQYYLDIIARSPSQAQFQHSWFSRLWPYQDPAQSSAQGSAIA
ncbi:glycoside hydrolase family 108 protein [Mucilaginibacter sp. McL0603]|uniref:glycoside hydrolase family 108 protein n=1 Tax=Mucilaginibacter sp. McL0603 TaxID=3415670 RepID=UPI003CEAD3A2